MDDPRTQVEAFAALIARVADPFTVEAVVLAACGLDAPGFAQLSSDWSARLAGDGSLTARFEAAFQAARRATTATGPEPQPTEETLFVQPDAAARAALLVPPLPFREGTFVPPPSDRASRDAGAGSSIDETLLPYETPGIALPFSPKTDREGEPR